MIEIFRVVTKGRGRRVRSVKNSLNCPFPLLFCCGMFCAAVLENLGQTIIPDLGSLESQHDFRTPEFEEFNGKSDSLFFNDGQRRIDFVLVYEDESRKETSKKGTNEKQRRKRQAYESNLICHGLQLEATRSVLDDKLVFVKVHAPWEVLCTYAEIMHIKLPLKPNDLKNRSSAFGTLNWFTKVLSVDESIIKPEQEFFTAPFEKNRMNDFYIVDRDAFFNPATRSRIVYFILSRVKYQLINNVSKFGINRLVNSGIYKAAFPLHDCKFRRQSEDPSCPNERYLLYREWAHPRSIYKKQPLDLIRKYYGEKIGIYFAWLGYYTQMLLLAAVVGVACFLYGYLNQDNCTWSKEVCHPDIGGKIIMCPQCDRLCPFWKLNITCESSKKLCIFDSFGTLVFAVFMGVWVTLFLEFWKRRQAELEYEWDTVELQQEEQARPEYEARCTHVVINEITQEEERIPFTAWGKCIRITLCASAVFFWILLIIASVIGIIVYRLSVFIVFSAKLPKNINGTDPIQKYLTPQTATSITASIISFIIIMILNTIYEKVAIMITNFELPRTQTDYENSLTMKMFLFQFVNYYSSCFYIAFFKGKFVGYPGDPVYWLGKYRNEECDPGGCLLELTTQLTIIMGGKAIWNNIQEVLLPWIMNLIGRFHRVSGSEKITPRWEQDYHLQPMGKLGLFYEYLEMIIQFGFVTLFVASFPLAPLLALVNNILEIRVDAWKLTTQFRRLVPEKAQDIGAWQPIMQGIAILAVVTNAMIIAFTSDMIPRLVYYWSFSVPPYGDHTSYTMEGYINNTLSIFKVADFKNKSKGNPYSELGNHTTCRYRDFRYPPGHPQEYKHNIYYWHVIAAKLAFIIVMEHIIYSVKFFISYAIPDVSKRTKSKIQREKYLTQKLLHENHLKDMTKNMGVIAERMIEAVDNNLRPKLE
ncbi:anoctamin-6 isoform X3 [Macaca thibetana thibetana]|uniref:anoctamin-6 isoform X3 n=1 Tax=Macaca thibetana thibetana TaxID=257877 RepID=UPI0021BC65B2|nr:anoctamin-6 isoform X3 [Macaca thibetana thibetana]